MTDILENTPELWLQYFPARQDKDHKYDHGHAVIIGSDDMTGAARLAAMGARRIGAGLLTIGCPSSAMEIYKTKEPGTIVKKVDNPLNLDELLTDKHKNAVLIGSGFQSSTDMAETVEHILSFGKPTVLDAGACTSFADNITQFTKVINNDSACVLTPHEGEFKKLFPNLEGTKAEKAQKAANELGAIIVLKGSETVIASPDGKVTVNTHAAANLATAGTGDVLAGFILGLLAQNMDPFYAACAAVWLHGDISQRFGTGLIAEDLPEHLPESLKNLNI